MKQLAILTLLSLLTACTMGCESTPTTPIKLPALPAPEKVKPDEPVASFTVGDKFTITDDEGVVFDGEVLKVGAVEAWIASDTNEQRMTRSYTVKLTREVDRGGLLMRMSMTTDLPEFLMIKK